jgi:hypothetical protein
MNVIPLSAIRNEELVSLLNASEVVALLGSGISLWAPSDLPTGGEFKTGVFQALFHDDHGSPIDPNPHLLNRYYKLLPFEIVNERCPDEDTIREFLKSIYHAYRPNPIHELFARLMRVRSISSIITPNYDCCMDAAIAAEYQVTVSQVMGDVRRVIFKEQSVEANDLIDPVYFKIHGSTDDVTGQSLVFRLGQEGVLDPWKRKLFRKLIRGKTLFIMGYSGTDFDICPEISLSEPIRVVWNLLNWDQDDLHPNLELVAKKTNTEFIIGDMRELLSRMNFRIDTDFGHSSLDINQMVRNKFPQRVRRLWRIRVYNSLNYNLSALRETRKLMANAMLNEEDLFDVLSEHAGASASFGKYRQAARSHDRASRIGKDAGMPHPLWVGQILLACDAWRCYGSFPRALFRWWQANRRIRDLQNPPPQLVADLDRNYILITRHAYDLFKRLHMRFLAAIVQTRVLTAISRTVVFLRQQGAWYQLQQLGMWRERFDLPEEVSTYGGDYQTPPSIEGYTQLNFPMGRMMAFRLNHDRSGNRLTDRDVLEARELARDATELGITPEIWKMHLLILRRAEPLNKIRTDFQRFWKAFRDCEYSLLFRIWRLILGG